MHVAELKNGCKNFNKNNKAILKEIQNFAAAELMATDLRAQFH
jgi:UDP-N-acetylglucosamine enolpyruvyl transferase